MNDTVKGVVLVIALITLVVVVLIQSGMIRDRQDAINNQLKVIDMLVEDRHVIHDTYQFEKSSWEVYRWAKLKNRTFEFALPDYRMMGITYVLATVEVNDKIFNHDMLSEKQRTMLETAMKETIDTFDVNDWGEYRRD